MFSFKSKIALEKVWDREIRGLPKCLEVGAVRRAR